MIHWNEIYILALICLVLYATIITYYRKYPKEGASTEKNWFDKLLDHIPTDISK